MTEPTIEPTIEKKFQQFRQSIKVKDFNNIVFLTAKAEHLEAQDAALAKRILLRVDNLKKQGETSSKGQESKVKEESNKQQDTKSKQIQANLLTAFSPLLTFLTKRPFIALVVIPTLLFALYQNFWATERYVSRAQVIVQQPDGMATMDTSMALLAGFGMPSTGIADTELVKAYILSNDMLQYLDNTLNLRQHFSQESIDTFSRSDATDSREDFYDYYLSRLDIYIDSKSNIVHVDSQAFDAQFAHNLTKTIVARAEWYINSIGHQLANAQLKFIQKESLNIEQRLEQAQTKLLKFQQKYNLLDPMAEGLAMQQITYGLEGQISAKETELKGLLEIMTPNAPQVIVTKNQLTALKNQLEIERIKLSDPSNNHENSIPVSEILAKYTDFKVKMELALQAYTSSQISLEKSRIEAYRQLKYLVVLESATKPHEAKYPEVFYNIALFGFIAGMLFVIGRIVILTIRELK